MPIIEIKNLSHVYGKDTPFEKKAIKNVSLSIEKNEFIGIIGHTGSGKSTLVQHLNGLLKPSEGTIFLDGEDIFAEPKKLRDVRFKVGLVFQYPEYQLFEDTVYKDIAFGPTNMKITGDELDKRVREAARFVGLKEELLTKSPFDLSGGEKRRAAIAGVIAMRPEVLILDEPTAGLDPDGRREILTQIDKFRLESGTTVILVSHSMEDIAEFADRVVVMNRGRAEMFDTVANVFKRAEELEFIGLRVPQITKIFMLLSDYGIENCEGVFSMTDGLERAKLLLGGGSNDI